MHTRTHTHTHKHSHTHKHTHTFTHTHTHTLTHTFTHTLLNCCTQPVLLGLWLTSSPSVADVARDLAREWHCGQDSQLAGGHETNHPRLHGGVPSSEVLKESSCCCWDGLSVLNAQSAMLVISGWYLFLDWWSLKQRYSPLSWADSLHSHVVLHEWLAFYRVFWNVHRSGVLTMLAWLVPHETAAVSAHVLWTPYNHAPCHFMQSHICKVDACLAVTCTFGRTTGIFYVLPW